MTITPVIVPDHVELTSLDDAALLSLQGELAASRRRLDALSARVSAELGRRSAPELGYAGLAQRTGSRTTEALVQRVSGVTRGEARALIRVGSALDGSSPWLAPVADAVASGELSIAAADGIVAGLGEPGESVTQLQLAEAAVRLVMVAGQTTPERVASAARSIRDDLDLAGVDDREHALRDRRFLRLIPQPDGMTKILGLLDPESAAIVVAAVDAVTSPRRGGPRFVDAAARARAEAIVADTRSTEQIAADALVDMVRLACAADPDTLFGTTAPSVRLHVTLAEMKSGTGAAQLEGQTARVGVATAQRLACGSGYVPVLFDETRPLDVGRSERLFTWRQRVALAARDGGCISRSAIGHRAGPRRTTSTSGREIVGEQTSSAAYCCADITTCCCTTTGGRCPSTTTGTGSLRRVRLTPIRSRSRRSAAASASGCLPDRCSSPRPQRFATRAQLARA